jgi:hypothetical protein
MATEIVRLMNNAHCGLRFEDNCHHVNLVAMHILENAFLGRREVEVTIQRSKKVPSSLYHTTFNYATLPITNAATPSSSLRTSIFIVTPVFALKAIRTIAATLPPVIVFP